VLDRVKVRKVRGPIYYSYTLFCKPIPDLIGSMDSGIVLHKDLPVVVKLGVLGAELSVLNLDIRVGGVPMFL
jgi:hypothetical protein